MIFLGRKKKRFANFSARRRIKIAKICYAPTLSPKHHVRLNIQHVLHLTWFPAQRRDSCCAVLKCRSEVPREWQTAYYFECSYEFSWKLFLSLLLTLNSACTHLLYRKRYCGIIVVSHFIVYGRYKSICFDFTLYIQYTLRILLFY